MSQHVININSLNESLIRLEKIVMLELDKVILEVKTLPKEEFKEVLRSISHEYSRLLLADIYRMKFKETLQGAPIIPMNAILKDATECI